MRRDWLDTAILKRGSDEVSVQSIICEIKRRTPDRAVHGALDSIADLYSSHEITLTAFCSLAKSCAPPGVPEQVVADIVDRVCKPKRPKSA